MATSLEFRRLRVSGFKSFCDPVELDIGHGLTGIVGPNGCGKSNIVEALRWVMGESSAKGLRGSEMSDVIFGGSSVRAAYDIARVSLSVSRPKPGDGALPASPTNGATEVSSALTNGHVAEEPRSNGHEAAGDGLAEAAVAFDLEELEIERRISRAAGSAYRINGREARARDVQLVFADAGSGARSPAIIGQGQIAFVVDAKPEDRRRLLEDAAGIGGLHGRRREAELKLAATERNLERVLDRIAGQDERLSELEKQSKQAQRYKKLQDQIRKLEALSVLARLRACERAVAEARARHLEAERAHALAESSRGEAEQAHARAEAAVPPQREAVALASALLARSEERLAAAEATLRQREREISILADQLADIDERIRTGREEAETAGRAIVERAAAAEEAERRLAELRGEIDSLAVEEKRLTNTTTEQGRSLQALDREIAAAETRKETLEQGKDRLERQFEQVRRELQRIEEVDDDALVEMAGRKLREAEAEQAESKAESVELLEQIGKLREQRDQARARAEAHREAHDAAVAGRMGLEARVNEARRAHADRRSRLERIDREISTARNSARGQSRRASGPRPRCPEARISKARSRRPARSKAKSKAWRPSSLAPATVSTGRPQQLEAESRKSGEARRALERAEAECDCFECGRSR